MSMDIFDSLPAGKDIIQIKIIDEPVKSVEVLLSSWKIFPDLYEMFLLGKIARTDKKTLGIEEKGKVLIKSIKDGKSKKDDFCKFCSLVIEEWGGTSGNRVWGKFKKNSNDDIEKYVRKSVEYLENKNIKDAIKEITELKGLGVSYGSKILRMLSPEQAGVYDSVLAKYLPYDKDVENKEQRAKNYAKFCAGCQNVVGKLKSKSIEKKNGGEWRVADVEAVLFFACYKKQKSEVTYEF